MPDLHPLTRTFEKLNAISSYYSVEVGAATGERWFTFSEILHDGSAYDTVAASILANEPKASRRYVGLRILSSMAWLMNLSALGSYLIDQRVPNFTEDNLSLHWRDEGWADSASFGAGFYALRGDPAADHPDVTILDNEDALRDVFRRQYEANIAALVEPLKARSGLGKGAVWACAADYCVSMIINAVRQMKQLERCDAEVSAIVQVADSPLHGKADVLWIEAGDRREPFLDRGGCCLWYTVAEEANSYCSTCPLRSLEDRIDRLRATLVTP